MNVILRRLDKSEKILFFRNAREAYTILQNQRTNQLATFTLNIGKTVSRRVFDSINSNDFELLRNNLSSKGTVILNESIDETSFKTLISFTGDRTSKSHFPKSLSYFEFLHKLRTNKLYIGIDTYAIIQSASDILPPSPLNVIWMDENNFSTTDYMISLNKFGIYTLFSKSNLTFSVIFPKIDKPIGNHNDFFEVSEYSYNFPRSSCLYEPCPWHHWGKLHEDELLRFLDLQIDSNEYSLVSLNIKDIITAGLYECYDEVCKKNLLVVFSSNDLIVLRRKNIWINPFSKVYVKDNYLHAGSKKFRLKYPNIVEQIIREINHFKSMLEFSRNKN